MQALVVDDSAAVRGLLSEHLRQLGFEVEQAATGFEALAKVQTLQELAVVLLDWTMPGMDGLEVLRRVRADGRYAAVPVVMVTTEGELPFVDDAFNAGASEYLMKPFDAQTLLEKLLLLGVDPEMRRAA
jgi:two-component system chemotaxis response regulator CheY